MDAKKPGGSFTGPEDEVIVPKPVFMAAGFLALPSFLLMQREENITEIGQNVSNLWTSSLPLDWDME